MESLLQKKLSQYKIILASKSPRREELIKNLHLNVSISVVDNIDESFPSDMPAHDVAKYLSQIKFQENIKVAKSNELIITADTTVCVDNVVLNKPIDEQDAIRMLEMLSGRSHEVITGITFGTVRSSISFEVSTLVTFKKLEINEILYYIKVCKPYDKAGAYGIQEWIGHIGVSSISGSYFNVVGLPVQHLYEELLKFND